MTYSRRQDDFQFSATQAFTVSSHYWRGTADSAGKYYIGVIYAEAQEVTSVQYMQGWCNERVQDYPASSTTATCTVLERWNGEAWTAAGTHKDLKRCVYYNLTRSTQTSCDCPASQLGDGVCQPQCNSAICQFDNGDCRVCPESAPEKGAANYSQSRLLGSKVTWSCQADYVLSGATEAVCLAPTDNATAAALWSEVSQARGRLPKKRQNLSARGVGGGDVRAPVSCCAVLCCLDGTHVYTSTALCAPCPAGRPQSEH